MRMDKRSVAAVVLYSMFTGGIYTLYWWVQTKDEMNHHGADIPTAWLLIVPIVQFWWVWQYCRGVEHVTRGRMSQGIAFLLLMFTSVVGLGVVQSAFNRAIDEGMPGQLPLARVA